MSEGASNALVGKKPSGLPRLRAKSSCFTLIEVLVATTILLATIVVSSNIYLTSIASTSAASNHLVINRIVPSLMDGIQFSIRQGAQQGQTTLGNQGVEWDVKYQWSAVVERSSSAPQYFSDIERRWVRSERQYQLWAVALTLELNGTTREVSYRELAWGPG